MNPIDYALIAVIVLILGGCIYSIIRAKKSGKKCIGCPESSKCGHNCGSCGGNCGK